MRPLIPVWTKQHTYLAILLTHAAVGIAILTHAQDAWSAIIIAILFLLTAILGLAFDVAIGLVAGITSAALSLALHHSGVLSNNGVLSSVSFLTGFIHAFFFTTTAIAASRIATQYRPVKKDTALHSLAPPFLIDRETGLILLEAEFDRFKRHHRPFSLIRLSVNIPQPNEFSQEQQTAMLQAVARTISSILRVNDVPFVYCANSIVAILLETDAEGAFHLLHRFNRGVSQAKFKSSTDALWISLHDHAHVLSQVVLLREGNARVSDFLQELENAPFYCSEQLEEIEWKVNAQSDRHLVEARLQ